MINIILEFGLRGELKLNQFGTENLQQSLSVPELILHQLPVIQYREKMRRGSLPEV
jgi:hypothetical protein